MITVKFKAEIHAPFGNYKKNDIANLTPEQFDIVKNYVQVM
jgi:hypothetical protein